jgi:type I restriction enzyme, S subunit
MLNLITKHIDIWTSAQIQKNNRGRGRRKNSNGQSSHGIKKLRELILELAMRGKLVPQDPMDEPASVLLNKIAEEKAQLIKEGKLKKQKKLPEISEDEKLFELPDAWEWNRLGNVGNIFNGNSVNSRLKEEKYTNIEGGLPFIATKDVGYGWEELDYDNGVSIPKDEPKFKVAHKGAVLICSEGGSAGKKCGITNQDICFGNKLYAIELYVNIESSYILANYLSPMFFGQFSDKMTGIIGGISAAKFSQLLLPVPPLAEQHRIVAKVDELMALCDRLEEQQTDNNDIHQTLVKTLLSTLTNVADQRRFANTWQRIANHFDTLFTSEQSIDHFKQTILQLAVMGKLVSQDPNDEPASVLLERIAKEKARLVKEGKIKKQKQLPEISEDEKPFELAEGWALSRFSEVSQEVSTGPFGSMIHKRDYVEGGIPLINPSHMVDCSISEEKSVAVGQNKAEELLSYKLEEGDIVMARRGEMGRCALVTEREDGWLCGTGSFRLKFHVDICRAYILLLFKNEKVREYLGGKSVGMTMTNLNHGILKMMPVPLPPVAEQKRIVAKVDGLMTLCDTLKARLNDAQTTQVQLADAIVERAVA